MHWSILSGVENRVRETTIYGEVGVELHKVEASVGARYTVSKLSAIRPDI